MSDTEPLPTRLKRIKRNRVLVQADILTEPGKVQVAADRLGQLEQTVEYRILGENQLQALLLFSGPHQWGRMMVEVIQKYPVIQTSSRQVFNRVTLR